MEEQLPTKEKAAKMAQRFLIVLVQLLIVISNWIWVYLVVAKFVPYQVGYEMVSLVFWVAAFGVGVTAHLLWVVISYGFAMRISLVPRAAIILLISLLVAYGVLVDQFNVNSSDAFYALLKNPNVIKIVAVPYVAAILISEPLVYVIFWAVFWKPGMKTEAIES